MQLMHQTEPKPVGGGSKLVTSAQLPVLVKILAAAGVSTLAQKHTQFGLMWARSTRVRKTTTPPVTLEHSLPEP